MCLTPVYIACRRLLMSDWLRIGGHFEVIFSKRILRARSCPRSVTLFAGVVHAGKVTMRRFPLHDASCKFHIGGGRILLALLLTSVLFRQSDVRADSLPVFVSASVTGVNLKVIFSEVVTCPVGCFGFTLRVPGTSTTYPILNFVLY